MVIRGQKSDRGNTEDGFFDAYRIQQMGTKPMDTSTRYSGDDLGTEATHPFQQKTTKRQQTRIRPMTVGTQQDDSSLKVETNPYLKRAR